MAVPWVGLARMVLTLWLLVLVYQGSRVALTIVLFLICAAQELTALVTKWERGR